MVPFIDLKAQQDRIRPQLDAAIARVLDHGQYIMGPEVTELEENLAGFVNSKHAIACSSGTDALLLGLMAYGVGPGDAIFTSPFTFIATAEVIALLGATPVFVDIDPRTFNISPTQLLDAVERVDRDGKLRPRGIIPVDLFGLPADYDRIMPTAEAHGLFVLEDAAQSYGAVHKGRRAPTLGHVGAASFFPAKPLGCYGDGGAVFTEDDELAAVMRSLLAHGKGDHKYSNVRIGVNARMDTLQAAILIEKLRIYPEEIERRQVVAAGYGDALQDTGLTLPSIPPGMVSVYAQYSVLSDSREDVQAKLKAAGVPTAVYYPRPLHLQEAFADLGYGKGDFPVAEEVSAKVFSLPFHPYLRTAEQRLVREALIGS